MYKKTNKEFKYPKDDSNKLSIDNKINPKNKTRKNKKINQKI